LPDAGESCRAIARLLAHSSLQHIFAFVSCKASHPNLALRINRLN